MIWLLLLATRSLAAEVVWLEAPNDADRDRVAAAAGATGDPLEPVDLRAAATAWSTEDQANLDALEATLNDVRAYETKLDGELLIMRDLTGPIDAIELMRDDGDRNRVYAALAYQGFAVNRYFGESLSADPEAEPFRIDIDGSFLEAAWVHAVAIDPTRDVTPYDIAEAPQRVAYAEVAETVQGALPASITPNLPDGAQLFVDGRRAELGPSGNMKVLPGRHWAHVEMDGRVLARWQISAASGEGLDLSLELDDAAWTGFLEGLADGVPIPEALLPSIEAMQGEVWVARPSGDEPAVFALTPAGAREVELPAKERVPASSSDGELFSVVLGAQGGWFYSGDFLQQSPVPNPGPASVNAVSMAGLAAADLNLGGFYLGAGLQGWIPLGDDKAAKSRDAEIRLRLYPHLAGGIRYAQLTVGYLFPYHPGVGARVMVPVAGAVEAHVSGLYGLPGDLKYDDGSVYESFDVRTLGAGAAVRF